MFDTYRAGVGLPPIGAFLFPGGGPAAQASGGAGGAGPAAGGQVLTPAQVYQQVVTSVQQATAQVQLPPSQPVIGPDPARNEWHKLAVGLPVWFWTDEAAQVDASRTQNGIAITLVAHRGATTFDLGDGTSITCDTMTPRPESAEPMATSPDCGHVYTRHGTYTITAHTTWNLQWSALGYSGTDTMDRSATTQVTVGQLASVVVR